MPSRSAVFTCAVVAALVAVAGRWAVGVTFGLSGDYFIDGRSTTETPSRRAVDREISTAALADAWLGDPPPRFHVRWFGYLTVRDSGTYRFAVESDDGARLTIDGDVAIDNGGVHGPLTGTAERELRAGAHPVLLEYTQAGGGYALAWRWARGDAPLGPVAPQLLSPRRVAPWRLTAAWTLETALAGAVLVLMVVAAAAGVAHRSRLAARVGRHPRSASLALFVLLTVAHTWPLARHPARLSRNDNGDTILNEWVISWVAHQAVRDPLALFDANIFYPDRRTLAYSETMAVQSALAAPVLWLGGSPVLAYNLVLLAGFALTGWTMSLVLAGWTGSWLAAITGGAMFAFNAHNFTRLPHLQAQHGEFLPLALLALDGLLRRPGLRSAAALSAWFVLQALTSIYLLVITAIALAAAAAVRPREWWAGGGRAALWTVVAALAAAMVLAPFVWPYWRVSADLGLTRSLDNATAFAARWSDYLATPARLHYATWSARFFAGTALFPGAVALVLAVVAIARGLVITDVRARMCLAVGIVGLYLSFGAHAPGYAALYHWLPPLQAIRAVSRFGYLVTFAAAALAAFALADLSRAARRRPAKWLLAVVPLIVFVESTPAPVWYARYDGIPSIYDRLRDAPKAIVLEVPFYPSTAGFRHAPYMLNSTRHWRPMLNGYSGFQPPSFREHADQLFAFPEGSWRELVRRRGVTHLFVHSNAYPPAVLTRLDTDPALRKLAEQDGIVLYAVVTPL